MQITNQQEWSVAIGQVVELLAECNKYDLSERAKDQPMQMDTLVADSKRLIALAAENADACGLFEMVAEKIQEQNKIQHQAYTIEFDDCDYEAAEDVGVTEAYEEAKAAHPGNEILGHHIRFW